MKLNGVLQNITLTAENIYFSLTFEFRGKTYSTILPDYRELCYFYECELAKPICIEADHNDIHMYIYLAVSFEVFMAFHNSCVWEDFEEWLQKE